MGPLTVNNEQQNVLLSGFTTNLYLYDFAGSKIVQLFLFVDVERDGWKKHDPINETKFTY